MSGKTDHGFVVAGLLNQLKEIDERDFITDAVKLAVEIKWLRDSVQALLLIEAKRQDELAQMQQFFESLGPDLGTNPPAMGA